MTRRAPLAFIVTCLLTLPTLAASPTTKRSAPELKLTIDGRLAHPTVYLSHADIDRARANRDRYPWAKAAAAKLLRQADEWAKRDDAVIIALVPAPASCYAYGFTGCPVC